MTINSDVADQLDSYIRFRASREGVGYALSPAFFREHLAKGVATFFGVAVRDDELVEDEQRPDLFAEWMQKEGVETNGKMNRTWRAMVKFAGDQSLTDREWDDLSYLSLVDRNHLYFGPENVKWAQTKAERADNLAFYKSLGPSTVH